MVEKIGLQAIFDDAQFQKGLASFIKGLDQARTANTQTADAVNQTSKDMGQGSVAAYALAGAVGGAMAAAFTKVVGVIGDAASSLQHFASMSVKSAARIEELHLVTQLLGQRAGYSADAIDEQTAAIKELGIRTDVALSLQAQFARYQYDMAKATELARVAQDAAVISGKDSSDTLEDLLWGIQTYNVRILRTAGINVMAEEAFRRFADANGLAADSLTETQRQTAMLNAVLEEGTRLFGVYETAITTAGKQYRTLTQRLIPELQAAIGQFFLPAWGTMVDAISDGVKWMTAAVSEGGVLYDTLIKVGAAAKFAAQLIHDSFFANQTTLGAMQAVNVMPTTTAPTAGTTAPTTTAPISPETIVAPAATWSDSGLLAAQEWMQGFSDADWDILSAVQGPIQSALSLLASAGKIGKEEVGGMFTNILTGNFDVSGLGIFAGAIGSLVEKQRMLAQATQDVENAENALAAARDALTASYDEVDKAVAEYNALLRQGASEEILRAKQAEIDAALAARDAAADAVDTAEENVDVAKDNVDAVKDQATAQAQLVNTLLALAQAQLASAEAADQQMETYSDAVVNIGASVNKIGADIDAQVAKLQEEWGRTIPEVVQTGWNKIVNAIDESWNKYLEDEWPKSWSEYWEEVQEKAKIMFGGLTEDIKKAWDWFWTTYSTNAKTAFSTVWNWIKTSWNWFWNEYTNNAQMALSGIWSWMLSGWNWYWTQYRNNAIEAYMFVFNWIQSAWNSVTQYLLSSLNSIIEAYNSIAGLVGLPTVGTFGGAMVEGMGSTTVAGNSLYINEVNINNGMDEVQFKSMVESVMVSSF